MSSPITLDTPDSPQTSALEPANRLTFRPLSVVPDGAEFLVGNAEIGVFIAIPELGVIVLRLLESGAAIGEVAETMTRTEQDVDVLDFAATLLECGFVLAVDATPLIAGADAASGRTWVAGIGPKLVQPFFSRTAWTAYGLLFAFCVATFLLNPQLWPTYEDTFFYPDAAICVLVLLVINTVLMAGHEICHWLGARAEGAAARFRVSRRLFLPTFETDLSQLWAVPRSQRYSAFLAGMAFDTVVLSGALVVRLLASRGMVDAPLLERLLGAVVFTRVLGLAFQAVVFLRTDLYAVMVTALGCVNLYRVTYLILMRKVRNLRPAEVAELATARARDLQVAGWFAWLYLAGLGLAAYFFVRFFIPGTVVLAGWILGSLRGAALGSAAFWEALVIGSVTLGQALLPLGVYAWEQFQTRRGAAA